jgi:hypothetical protein
MAGEAGYDGDGFGACSDNLIGIRGFCGGGSSIEQGVAFVRNGNIVAFSGPSKRQKALSSSDVFYWGIYM